MNTNGRTAAVVGLLLSLLAGAYLIGLGWLDSGSSNLGAVILVSIPTLAALVGFLAGYASSQKTTFIVRIVVTVFLFLWGTVGITLLGLYFLPAAVAFLVSTVQSRPK